LERKAAKQGKLVNIYIWRASTREVVAKIFGFHRRAVRQLAFSPSGKKLLSIGEDDQHMVAIYDWASQTKLCDAAVDQA
jgi:WD40 repeat protein